MRDKPNPDNEFARNRVNNALPTPEINYTGIIAGLCFLGALAVFVLAYTGVI